ADDALDPAGVGEALERQLVVELEDRATVREAEAGRGGSAVYCGHMAAARASGREQPGAARAEHEQPHEGPPYNGPVTSILGERVAELRAEREHGARRMGRRAGATARAGGRGGRSGPWPRPRRPLPPPAKSGWSAS